MHASSARTLNLQKVMSEDPSPRHSDSTQVLSSVASKAVGATGVAPNLMTMALDALNDTAHGSLHTEDEQLTLGRVLMTTLCC